MRRFFIRFLFGTLLLSTTQSTASAPAGGDLTVSLRGIVLESGSSAPIPYATVSINDIGQFTKCGPDGVFVIRKIESGQHDLTVSAVGYITRERISCVVNSEQPTYIRIQLEPTIYLLGSVSVEATKELPAATSPTVIDRAAIRKEGARTVADLLETLPGILISSDIASGESVIRIRGSSPDQVLVLVDGHPINASGSSVANLNTIPVELIERVEIYKGASSARLGPGAMSGAINIVTQPTAGSHLASLEITGLSGEWGSFKRGVIAQNILPVDKWENRWAISRRDSRGDFGYSVSVAGSGGSLSNQTGVRSNNQSCVKNLWASGLYRLRRGHSLAYSVQSYSGLRGLPGPVTRTSLTSAADDDRFLLTLSHKLNRSRNMSFESNVGYSRLKQGYLDTLAFRAFDQFLSRYENDIISLKQSANFSFNDRGMLKLMADYGSESMTHTDALRPVNSMGKGVRSSFGLAADVSLSINLPRALFVRQLRLEGTVRYDQSRTTNDRESTAFVPAAEKNETDFISPRVGFVLSGGDRTAVSISGSYSRALRLPSLNALFWRADARSAGNPDLRPELSSDWQAVFSAQHHFGKVRLSSSLTIFRSDLTDLVVWQMGQGDVFRPTNLGSAKITGHEDVVELSFFDDLLSLQYANTVTDARNRVDSPNSFDKRLTFYPHYMTSLSVHLKYKIVTAAFARRSSGRVYLLEANTKWYEGYDISDFRLGLYARLFGEWQGACAYRVDNLTNTNYSIIGHYPMPGRSGELSFKLTWGGGDRIRK
ncbi:MAG: TonB-dependent receptor [candidate division Zixibacteria bacterium]